MILNKLIPLLLPSVVQLLKGKKFDGNLVADQLLQNKDLIAKIGDQILVPQISPQAPSGAPTGDILTALTKTIESQNKLIEKLIESKK